MNQKLKLAGAAAAGIVVTLIAGSIALASADKGIGPIGNADADSNGEITRAEWAAAATRRFDALDANKDGKLVVGEIPRGGERGRHGRRHGPGRDDWGHEGPPPAFAEEPAEPPVEGNGN